MEKILRAVVPLLTPTGKVIVPIKVIYDNNADITNPKSQITCYMTEWNIKEPVLTICGQIRLPI